MSEEENNQGEGWHQNLGLYQLLKEQGNEKISLKKKQSERKEENEARVRPWMSWL